jgi:glycosyltransferase involved in cell wall biosynthesis
MKICFLDFSTKLKTIFDLQSNARGGMVTSLFKVSDGLAKLGHDVTVCADIEQPNTTASGVKWSNTPPFQLDALILNRGLGQGYPSISARNRFLWTHDLPHHGFALDPMVFKAITRVVFMSEYAEYIWRTFYRGIGKSAIISNGIDKNIFSPGHKFNNHLIYASAPNRGLGLLPEIFSAVKEVVPDASMQAFSNLSKLHPGEGGDPEKFAKDKSNCLAVGIEVLDPIPQSELSSVLKSSTLMIMPSQYPEICSNIILQSLACGTPVVTTGKLGSAPEWIKNGVNGILTQTMPHDYVVYQVEMARAIVNILRNEEKLATMQKKAEKTGILAWEDVANKWHKMLEKSCS